jgi:hypothetical protein
MSALSIPNDPTLGGPDTLSCDDCGEEYIRGQHDCRAEWTALDWLYMALELVTSATHMVEGSNLKRRRLEAIEMAESALSLAKEKL